MNEEKGGAGWRTEQGLRWLGRGLGVFLRLQKVLEAQPRRKPEQLEPGSVALAGKEAGRRSRGQGTLAHETSLGQQAGAGTGKPERRHVSDGLRSQSWEAWGDPQMGSRSKNKAETILGHFMPASGNSLSRQLPQGSAGQGPTLHTGHRSPRDSGSASTWLRWGTPPCQADELPKWEPRLQVTQLIYQNQQTPEKFALDS